MMDQSGPLVKDTEGGRGVGRGEWGEGKDEVSLVSGGSRTN